MHPNPAFRTNTEARNLEFARDRGFGVLVVVENGAPLISHVPFVLAESGDKIDFHLVRSNPISRALSAPKEATLIVSGPDGYVSPDWYEVQDQVPTWNYVAVHLQGRLERLPSDELRPLLDCQSAHFENLLLPKKPWTSFKMEPEALERMMRMIAPFRLTIEKADGTWKLNQNKPDDVRLRASGKVVDGVGQELNQLADLMKST